MSAFYSIVFWLSLYMIFIRNFVNFTRWRNDFPPNQKFEELTQEKSINRSILTLNSVHCSVRCSVHRNPNPVKSVQYILWLSCPCNLDPLYRSVHT